MGNVGEAKASWCCQCTEINYAVQDITGVQYFTNYQHKEMGKSRLVVTPMIQKRFGTTLERRIHFIMAIHHCVTLHQEKLLQKSERV